MTSKIPTCRECGGTMQEGELIVNSYTEKDNPFIHLECLKDD